MNKDKRKMAEQFNKALKKMQKKIKLISNKKKKKYRFSVQN